MATPLFISQNAQSHNSNVSSAYNAAEEAYGDAQRAIYQEGEASQCETAEELNDLLRDHAQRVAWTFENQLRESDDKTSDEWKAAWNKLNTGNPMEPSFEDAVKEALESEVPDSVKAQLNF